MKVISESTPITLSLLLVVIGGVAWLTYLSANASAALSLAQRSDTRLASLEDRTARIETKIDDLLTTKAAMK